MIQPFIIIQNSDHKRDTCALCHGMHLWPSHFHEGCGNPVQRKKIESFILVMDGFHTSILFWWVTETYFKDVGLQDILIQSTVLANGSAEQAMTSSMYKRFIEMCKLCTKLLTDSSLNICW